MRGFLNEAITIGELLKIDKTRYAKFFIDISPMGFGSMFTDKKCFPYFRTGFSLQHKFDNIDFLLTQSKFSGKLCVNVFKGIHLVFFTDVGNKLRGFFSFKARKKFFAGCGFG